MRFEEGQWQFTRQMGIGEIQHVRSNLFGIGCFTPKFLYEQVEGALAAATELNKLGRVHINAGRVDMDYLNRIYGLMHRNGRMQLEDYVSMTEAKFAWLCPRLEILVEPLVEDIEQKDVAETVRVGVLRAWHESGERFLNGNFAYLTAEELQPKYPQFFYDYKPYWDQFNAHPI